MRTRPYLSAIFALMICTPLQAQGRGQFQPPPDHWMTLDSLVELVEIMPEQEATVAEHYEQINAMMKEVAEQRAELRAGMAGGPPTEADREKFMAFRDHMVEVQAKVDEHYQAIRELLTEEQQVRFDELAKPQLMPQGRGRRPQ